MRGVRPFIQWQGEGFPKFTPHARGSTFPSFSSANPFLVYPACAGIDRSSAFSSLSCCGLPRMRGDRPSVGCILGKGPQFTPHARGSTLMKLLPLRPLMVYPACAGIDPHLASQDRPVIGLPRMRGDRP